MNRRHLDWSGPFVRIGAMRKQKTGRNCLGPVTDSRRLGALPRWGGLYTRYTRRPISMNEAPGRPLGGAAQHTQRQAWGPYS